MTLLKIKIKSIDSWADSRSTFVDQTLRAKQCGYLILKNVEFEFVDPFSAIGLAALVTESSLSFHQDFFEGGSCQNFRAAVGTTTSMSAEPLHQALAVKPVMTWQRDNQVAHFHRMNTNGT